MSLDRRGFIAGASLLAAATPAVGLAKASKGQQTIRSIAVEEAFATPEQFAAMKKLLDGGGNYELEVRAWAGHVANPDSKKLRQLLDVEGERLAIMDETGLDMQVLSLTSPGVQSFDVDTAVGVAETANDRLAEMCRRHPTRFAGLASFAPQDPVRAAKEIERAMAKLKLNGLIVNSHTNGEYLDHPRFEPILEAAEATNAAIYIHPRLPPREMIRFFATEEEVKRLDAGQALSGSFTTLMGYTADTLLHGMRLLVAGVFDRYPGLKIVLGHMGEGLPFLKWKLDSGFEIFQTKKFTRKPSEYLRENFVYSTSGFFSKNNLDFILAECGPDSLMFGVDYPYYRMQDGMEFLKNLRLEDEVMRKVSHLNAERVFRIKAGNG